MIYFLIAYLNLLSCLENIIDFFGLGYIEYEASKFDFCTLMRTTSRTNCFNNPLNISLCNFGCKHNGLEFSSYSKSAGSVFHVPSVPVNNSSKICNRLSELFLWSFLFWSWFLLLYSDLSFCTYILRVYIIV